MPELPITTLEIEIAVMRHIGVRQNMIVNGVHWGLFLGGKYMHECDLLSLSPSNYATEIEIKISKADLLKDADKKHGHNHDYIKYLWFAVPETLKEIALNEIPHRAGLLIAKRYEANLRDKEIIIISIERTPQANNKAVKWSDTEKAELARLGVMRILGLKQNIQQVLVAQSNK